jgi:hypothetical protein
MLHAQAVVDAVEPSLQIWADASLGMCLCQPDRQGIVNQNRGTSQLRDWGGPLQHAFSQVSDWSWAKNDNQKSTIYQNAFGMPLMTETYLIVCGRRRFLNEVEKSRLHWRSEKTTIAACPIRFWTYDDRYDNCSNSMSAIRTIREEARRT